MKKLTRLEKQVLKAILDTRNYAYGLEINQHICQHNSWMSYGTMYTLLEGLEKRGLITSHRGEGTPERNWHAKMYFQLTPATKAHMEQLTCAE